MKSYEQLISTLSDLTDVEHCDGCSDDTCDTGVSMRLGYDVWAIEAFAHSGGASDEFDATYASLTSRFGKRWKADSEASRQDFCAAIVTAQCKGCNAYTMVATEEAVFFDEPFPCDSCHETMDALPQT